MHVATSACGTTVMAVPIGPFFLVGGIQVSRPPPAGILCTQSWRSLSTIYLQILSAGRNTSETWEIAANRKGRLGST